MGVLRRFTMQYVVDTHITQEQISLWTETFRMFDRDGSGAIDAEEFRGVFEVMGMKIRDEENVKNAFDVFDTDDSGSLSFEEMADVLMNMGQDMSHEKIRNIMELADVDGDGEIDIDEFMAVCSGRNF